MDPCNKKSKTEMPEYAWKYVWKSDRHKHYIYESELYITPELFVEYINDEIKQYKLSNPFDEPITFYFETYTIDDLINEKYIIFTNPDCGHTFKVVKVMLL